MKIFLIVLCLFALIPQNLSADTHAAADCEQATIVALIADEGVTNGDIITLPTGSCTWSSTGAVNFGTKKITLQGNGVDNTVITGETENTYIINMGTGGGRLTNFAIVGGNINAAGDGFLIDNMKLTSVSIQATMGSGDAGVIHSNQFLTYGHVVSRGTAATLTDGNAQNVLWAEAISPGSTDILYVEGNTFTKMDMNYAGKIVFRYNTIATPSPYIQPTYLEAHSIQSANNRASKWWEVYNNNITSDTYENQMMRLRGGTGVVINNSWDANWGAIYLDNVRSYSLYDGAGEPAGYCDGTREYDGNTGTGDSAGYPCRDQIGRGQDNTLWVWNSDRELVGAYDQPLLPAYFYGNTKNGATVGASVLNYNKNIYHIVENQDYYTDSGASCVAGGACTSGVGSGLSTNKPTSCVVNTAFYATDENKLYKCTSADPLTWTSYWTPGACPHPLTGLAGSCTADKGTIGYNVGAGTTYNVTVTLIGNAAGESVTHSPVGIVCGSGCTTHDEDTEVTLTAVNPDNRTVTWGGTDGGGCSGSTCTVTMSEARAVTATFLGVAGGQITLGSGGSMTRK